MFQEGIIHDVVLKDLPRFTDERGWLSELYRSDEIDPAFMPVMGYISVTKAGIARGPHEHVDQADYFCFIGPSTFRIYLWDNRKESPTFRVKHVFDAGEDQPKSVIVPAGVVHAYRNIGAEDGMVVNCANRLYRGKNKSEPVDEIRHENDAGSPFVLE